ncbi:MAG: hypothetical protein ACUVRA_08180 [Candidatus Bathyarchaeaceae archaeon]
MITGALAASYYGTPRTTTDVDIVVKVTRGKMQFQLISALRKAGMQVNEKRIHEAFASGFKIVSLKDEKTPFTLDIIFSDKRLEKKSGTILGLPTFYQTPQGLILAKLRMIKATVPREGALKDEDDVKAILRFTEVNMKLLKRRARKDSTLSILETLVADITSQNRDDS